MRRLTRRFELREEVRSESLDPSLRVDDEGNSLANLRSTRFVLLRCFLLRTSEPSTPTRVEVRGRLVEEGVLDLQRIRLEESLSGGEVGAGIAGGRGRAEVVRGERKGEMGERRAEERAAENMEGEETGGGEFGLSKVCVEVSDGLVATRSGKMVSHTDKGK